MLKTDAGTPVKIFNDTHTLTAPEIAAGTYSIAWTAGKTPIQMTGTAKRTAAGTYVDLIYGFYFGFIYTIATGAIDVMIAPNTFALAAGDIAEVVVVYK